MALWIWLAMSMNGHRIITQVAMMPMIQLIPVMETQAQHMSSEAARFLPAQDTSQPPIAIGPGQNNQNDMGPVTGDFAVRPMPLLKVHP